MLSDLIKDRRNSQASGSFLFDHLLKVTLFSSYRALLIKYKRTQAFPIGMRLSLKTTTMPEMIPLREYVLTFLS
jgi:hypothetical protein